MSRIVSKPIVQFKGESRLFVASETVSKLLIQSYGRVSNLPKETLDLNYLESVLEVNPLIKNAEVYVAVNGSFKIDIEQKTPIARVMANESYYVDSDGAYMPLSNNHSARVPLVFGDVKKNDLKCVYQIAKKINEDDFLKKHVIEIHQTASNKLSLKMRQCRFLVQIGDVNLLDKKINNLKAFYQKSRKEKTLDNYSNVNLQFDNQVVCTKI